MILSGAQSTGAAGRAFVVAWSFGSADVATGTLQVEIEFVLRVEHARDGFKGRWERRALVSSWNCRSWC